MERLSLAILLRLEESASEPKLPLPKLSGKKEFLTPHILSSLQTVKTAANWQYTLPGTRQNRISNSLQTVQTAAHQKPNQPAVPLIRTAPPARCHSLLHLQLRNEPEVQRNGWRSVKPTRSLLCHNKNCLHDMPACSSNFPLGMKSFCSFPPSSSPFLATKSVTWEKRTRFGPVGTHKETSSSSMSTSRVLAGLQPRLLFRARHPLFSPY